VKSLPVSAPTGALPQQTPGFSWGQTLANALSAATAGGQTPIRGAGKYATPKFNMNAAMSGLTSSFAEAGQKKREMEATRNYELAKGQAQSSFYSGTGQSAPASVYSGTPGGAGAPGGAAPGPILPPGYGPISQSQAMAFTPGEIAAFTQANKPQYDNAASTYFVNSLLGANLPMVPSSLAQGVLTEIAKNTQNGATIGALPRAITDGSDARGNPPTGQLPLVRPPAPASVPLPSYTPPQAQGFIGPASTNPRGIVQLPQQPRPSVSQYSSGPGQPIMTTGNYVRPPLEGGTAMEVLPPILPEPQVAQTPPVQLPVWQNPYRPETSNPDPTQVLAGFTAGSETQGGRNKDQQKANDGVTEREKNLLLDEYRAKFLEIMEYNSRSTRINATKPAASAGGGQLSGAQLKLQLLNEMPREKREAAIQALFGVTDFTQFLKAVGQTGTPVTPEVPPVTPIRGLPPQDQNGAGWLEWFFGGGRGGALEPSDE